MKRNKTKKSNFKRLKAKHRVAVRALKRWHHLIGPDYVNRAEPTHSGSNAFLHIGSLTILYDAKFDKFRINPSCRCIVNYHKISWFRDREGFLAAVQENHAQGWHQAVCRRDPSRRLRDETKAAAQ